MATKNPDKILAKPRNPLPKKQNVSKSTDSSSSSDSSDSSTSSSSSSSDSDIVSSDEKAHSPPHKVIPIKFFGFDMGAKTSKSIKSQENSGQRSPSSERKERKSGDHSSISSSSSSASVSSPISAPKNNFNIQKDNVQKLSPSGPETSSHQHLSPKKVPPSPDSFTGIAANKKIVNNNKRTIDNVDFNGTSPRNINDREVLGSRTPLAKGKETTTPSYPLKKSATTRDKSPPASMKTQSSPVSNKGQTEIFDTSVQFGERRIKNGDINRSIDQRIPSSPSQIQKTDHKISRSPTQIQKGDHKVFISPPQIQKTPKDEKLSKAAEETIFSQISGKKKTRKLPNLGDFQQQKRIIMDDLIDGNESGEDLSKEDFTELEKAEKLLEDSIASGKTKKILPEKEGETVRQELIIDGDKPGEKKTIIQEITKRRISNPGKLPKEFLAKMEKKDGGVYTIYETRTKMTTTRLQGHDTSEFANMDAEDLLMQLNENEIDELANDVDPDDPMLPPSDRCRTLTKKSPTGPLNRRNLLKYLERQSITEDDWDEPVPFSKEVRGKIWHPKERHPRDEYRISIDLPDEYEHALEDASEADLVDIAGILELHSLVNQTQYNNSLKSLSTEKGGFKSIARGDKLRILAPEPPNITNPEESLVKLNQNDPALDKLNLNNIRDISPSTYLGICRSLKRNTNIESLSLVNTRMTDTIAKVLADSIRENVSLRSINLESNALSPDAVVYLFGAACDNQNILEFKAANQRNTYLGNKAETEIASLMAYNHHLLRLGLTFNVPDARVRVAVYLKRNLDELRLKRLHDR
ncbi:uncharacterized protein LOC135929078 isoform X2 [Gordionus sp. m RMFG-2023]|uniref:uncharacterized protein LOC135929078 isoform X2 n=1 Tax=Gordionus sp. m RMFG-2023 TaxID=3053472 RepID=UPI0031FCDE2E